MNAWTTEEQEAYLEKLRLAAAEHEVAELRRRQRLLVKWKAEGRSQLLPRDAAQPVERNSAPAPDKPTEKPRGFSIPGARMPVKH